MGFRRLKYGFCLLGATITMNWPSDAESLEHQVKAAFLYNFAKFVEWPQTNPEVGGSFTLCMLGGDPFGPVLESTTGGKKVHGVPFTLRRIASTKETEGCRILFISASERKRFSKILEEIGGSELLTVSESPGFASQGGMINFFLEDDKVRFEINLEVVRRAGFQFSAQLLQLARLVGPQVAGKK